jgi:AraC-like DNA-binding protein
MKLFIKNMVCIRCVKVVENELEKMGIEDFKIQSGEARIKSKMSVDQLVTFKDSMHKLGLEVIDDRTTVIIEKIKDSINALIYRTEDDVKGNLSAHLSKKTGYDYKYLSNLFSTACGSSIEKYHIKKRIERVKELLIFSESSLSEIAFKVHYSSVSHLSAQFKKETGLTPTAFIRLNPKGSKNTVIQ